MHVEWNSVVIIIECEKSKHVCLTLISQIARVPHLQCMTNFVYHFPTLDQTVYDKLKKALTSDSLKKGISQTPPCAQTDCLEGFHSVFNLFAPKLIAYSYIGMYCR